MTALMMLSVILLSMLMILLSTLIITRIDSNWLLKQLELASELESDLQDTVDWGRKWLVDLNLKSSFEMLGLTNKLDWSSYIICTARTASKKIRAFIRPMKFFLLKLSYVSINLSFDHGWNAVVMSSLVLPV